MPEKDKKKDELTLDTTSPPPPRATVWRSSSDYGHDAQRVRVRAPRVSHRVRQRSGDWRCRAVLDGRLGASRGVRDPPSAGLLAPRPTRLDPPRFRTPSPPDTAVRVASESRSPPLVPLLPSQWLCVSDLDHVGADGMRSAWAQLAPWGAFALVSAFDLDPGAWNVLRFDARAPANVRVQRDRVEPDPGSESPPGDEQAPSTSKTNATRIDSGSSRRRGLKLSTPAEDEWRRVVVALNPDAFADAPRLDSPSSPWNRLAWRDVTGAGADVQLRDVVLESWSAIEPRDGSNPASDSTRGSIDDATNETSSASTTDFPSAPPAPPAPSRASTVAARDDALGGGESKASTGATIGTPPSSSPPSPPAVPSSDGGGRLSRGRPSPAGFSSRRSSPPWPRSSRFSSSPSRAPNALARVRNDDADVRSRRTRRSPGRFLVEVEVANAPRHHSPPSTSKPRETYRETPLSLGVLRERPRRVHEPRLDRPRPRESSNARSRGPDPARRFHRRRPRWAAARSRRTSVAARVRDAENANDLPVADESGNDGGDFGGATRGDSQRGVVHLTPSQLTAELLDASESSGSVASSESSDPSRPRSPRRYYTSSTASSPLKRSTRRL